VIDMFGLLTRDLGYDPRNVAVLTDDVGTAMTLQKPFLGPTCESVEALISGWSARAGDKDSLFLHFSGHGMQVADEDNDEADGFDEAVLLGDRPMIDDRLLKVLTGPLTHDARVFALVDSCHCGTVLDLAHTMGADGKVVSAQQREPHRGIVTCLAAADDAEEAADARSADGFVGVLSYAFRKVLKAHPNGLTYDGLLRGIAGFFERGKLKQSPKLSFNVQGFNVDQPLPFMFTGPAEPIRDADAVFTEVAARGCYPQQCCCPPPWSGCGGCCPPPPPPCCGPCYQPACYPRPVCCGRY
jgi:metacaspase-1